MTKDQLKHFINTYTQLTGEKVGSFKELKINHVEGADFINTQGNIKIKVLKYSLFVFTEEADIEKAPPNEAREVMESASIVNSLKQLALLAFVKSSI